MLHDETSFGTLAQHRHANDITSQQRLLEDVRPKRLHMGHRFKTLDGGVLESVVDGPDVERALRDSLATHDRMAEAARKVTNHDPSNPTASSLAPAAETLGFNASDPASWPPPLFITLHGHLVTATSAA